MTIFIALKKLTTIFVAVMVMACLQVAVYGQTKVPGKQEYLRFYPNPASTFINFDFLKASDRSCTIQIYNFLGKKVVEIKNSPSRNFIPLEDFYRGIYVYQLRDRNGMILDSGKFQVVK